MKENKVNILYTNKYAYCSYVPSSYRLFELLLQNRKSLTLSISLWLWIMEKILYFVQFGQFEGDESWLGENSTTWKIWSYLVNLLELLCGPVSSSVWHHCSIALMLSEGGKVKSWILYYLVIFCSLLIIG